MLKTPMPTKLYINPVIKQISDNGWYYMQNNLIPRDKDAVTLKQIPIDNQNYLNVDYQTGNKDEFLVHLYNPITNEDANYDNETLFKTWLKLAQTTNKTLFIHDILTIHNHVSGDYIDNVFLHQGIDNLVKKYPADQKLTANKVFSHCLLQFTSEIEYVTVQTGHPGYLKDGLKILGLYYLMIKNLTPHETNVQCSNKARKESQKEIAKAYQVFTDLGFSIR